MALRFEKSVVRGYIDNRERGRVTGEIWLLGQDGPVRLDLRGNAMRDIAGSVIQFDNPHPEPGDDVMAIRILQTGVVGDLTASRRIRRIDVPVEDISRLRTAGEPLPEKMENCLYLEWFSEENGRVVIEATGFNIKADCDISWRMSADEEDEQLDANCEAIRSWLTRASDLRDADDPVDPDGHMDEFEWERFLRESDERTDRYSEMLEKYMDHPDRERLIAREMGWTWIEDALDAEEKGALEEVEDAFIDEMPDLDPIPDREGTDWIRTSDGHIKHPLSQHAFSVAMDMWHYCRDGGLLNDDADDDLRDMLYQAQTLSAKLAGALDHLGYDDEPDGGFVVACLKRSLRYFDHAISACEKVVARDVVDSKRLAEFRTALFGIREEILRLMKVYRQHRL